LVAIVQLLNSTCTLYSLLYKHPGNALMRETVRMPEKHYVCLFELGIKGWIWTDSNVVDCH